MSKLRITKAGVALIIVGVATLAAVIYIMAHQMGLNPDLDFGAGAYYYADIPEYEKRLDWDIYTAKLPFWVYLVLFFLWGFIVWKLWKWIDRKK